MSLDETIPMKRFASLFALAFFAAPLMAADEKRPDFDPSKLEGKWKIVSGDKFGEKVEGKSLEGEITITKDTITIKSNETHVMKYKLDGKTSPISIDMEGTEGPAKGFKSQGIIELKGDELKLTYGMPEAKRPTAFGTKKGDQALSFVLKRAK